MNVTPDGPVQPDVGVTTTVGIALTVTATGAEVHEPVPRVIVILVVSPPPPVAAVQTPVPATIVAAEGLLDAHVVLPAPPVDAKVNVLPGAALHNEVVLVEIVGVVLTVTAEELA